MLNCLKKSALAAALICLAAGAVSAIEILVDPRVKTLMVSSGEEYTGNYSIVNTSTDTITIKIEPENWLRARGVDSVNAHIPVSDWFVFRPGHDEITLEPGMGKRISYDIKLPEDAQGELVAMNFFAIEVTREGRGASIRRRLGFPLYAAAEETSEFSCSVSDITVSTSSMSLKIENDGNVHLRPDVFMVIAGEDENPTEKIELVGRTPLFPGESERFSARQAALEELNLPSGRYITQPLIKYGENYGKDFSMKGDSVELIIE